MRATVRHAPREAGHAPKFVYFTPRDVLIPRVDRQCTMRFCDAMADGGFDARVVSLDVQLST